MFFVKQVVLELMACSQTNCFAWYPNFISTIARSFIPMGNMDKSNAEQSDQSCEYLLAVILNSCFVICRILSVFDSFLVADLCRRILTGVVAHR